MWALVHSLDNLNDPDTVVFTHGERNASQRVSLHDGERLMQILTMLDRVTGIDCLNGKSELERRTRAAMFVRDLKKQSPLQRIAGFSVSADEQRLAMLHLRGELSIDAGMRRLLLIPGSVSALTNSGSRCCTCAVSLRLTPT